LSFSYRSQERRDEVEEEDVVVADVATRRPDQLVDGFALPPSTYMIIEIMIMMMKIMKIMEMMMKELMTIDDDDNVSDDNYDR